MPLSAPPPEALNFSFGNLEKELAAALDQITSVVASIENNSLAHWALQLTGFGPVMDKALAILQALDKALHSLP